jgi:hypothetical protein
MKNAVAFRDRPLTHYWSLADLSVLTAKVTPFQYHVGYLRRSEIITWARDRSRPITVKVIMRTSGAVVRRPTTFTQLMFSLTESQKL